MADRIEIEARSTHLDMQAEPMLINIGPSHPATHATLRFKALLDGETIVDLESEFGYLHRGFEKESEAATWTQVIPYTDRLNYVSPLMNNVGYAMAVEKLCGIKTTERCDYIRVILSELSRIIDHMVCIGTNMVDLGALTNFWYFWKP
ncbi:MAG: NADH-quinone oxidoreductase subunit D, partial [Deltaproteobacteria bacterium]